MDRETPQLFTQGEAMSGTLPALATGATPRWLLVPLGPSQKTRKHFNQTSPFWPAISKGGSTPDPKGDGPAHGGGLKFNDL